MCAGALLAVGILNCGVQHENDPAYALLYDFVEKEDPVVRVGAIMGLGLAYSGTRKEEVRALFSPAGAPATKALCAFPCFAACRACPWVWLEAWKIRYHAPTAGGQGIGCVAEHCTCM